MCPSGNLHDDSIAETKIALVDDTALDTMLFLSICLITMIVGFLLWNVNPLEKLIWALFFVFSVAMSLPMIFIFFGVVLGKIAHLHGPADIILRLANRAFSLPI